jgi:ABC-type branched-subunit amino acid transport system ATPase component
MLEIDTVTKRFSGVRALQNVSLALEPGEIVGLIGPNGAGKTTLFNVVSGLLEPDDGAVVHDGTEITGWPPHRIAQAGITRSFQISRSLYTMTVLDNLLLMPPDQPGETITGALVRPAAASTREAAIRERAEEVLETVALEEMRTAYARELSGGQQKLLELGRALMTDPDAILLDEPLAGVAPELVPGLLERIERIARDRDVGILIIEHDLAAIQSVSDRLVVLSDGQVITSGPPEKVRNDDEVIELYVEGGGA